jgi:hypothetical protein
MKIFNPLVDGRCRFAEVYAFVVRFVDDQGNIQQRVAGLKLLNASLTGQTCAALLNEQITRKLGMDPKYLGFSMRDRASVNELAMELLKVFYPDLTDIGCISHAYNNTSDRFEAPQLKLFEEKFTCCVKLSQKAKFIYKKLMERFPKTGSRTRWWSRWETMNEIMLFWPQVHLWVDECTELDMCENSMAVMRDLLYGNSREDLQVQLATVIDVGERLVKSTYKLEGDGMLAPFAYNIMRENMIYISQLAEYLAQDSDEIFLTLPNVRLVLLDACSNVNDRENVLTTIRIRNKVKAILTPMINYFMEIFSEETGKVAHTIQLFKNLRIFDPVQFKSLNLGCETINSLPACFNDLKQGMIAELPTYRRMTEQMTATSLNCMIWFKERKDELPYFYRAILICALAQPSSAAVERVFSLLKNAQSQNQSQMLEDYLECVVMLRYNSEWRKKYME